MIPRGEVGLIFAQVGLSSGVFDESLFAGATLMVMVTTLLAPPLLKRLLAARPAPPSLEPAEGDGVEELVMDA
jgi:Kef-type K+ transport system membrane component KefB